MKLTTRTIAYETREKIFWTFAIALIALSGLYIYAVEATVSNTASRQNLESQIGTLSTKLGELEFKYISLKNDITVEVAQARGFREVTSPTYLSRAAANSLSINLNR